MEVKAAERGKIDAEKAQAAYAKRRSSLIRKANEISIYCDVDIAVVAFSPAGRVSKFCNKDRLEEIIERYINVEPDKRYPHIGCLEWKLHKIRQLHHIRGDENKLTHIDTQIKNLELQIKKSTLELGILQAKLKDYEPENGDNASIAEILHCEKNLKKTLQVIMDRKITLPNEPYPSLGQPGLRTHGQPPLANETYPSIFGQKRPQQKRQAQAQALAPLAYNYSGNQVKKKARKNQPSSSTQLPWQYDPRTWPYYTRFSNGASGSYAFNPPAAGYPGIYHPGYPPYITPQTHEIPPAYPPIQYQPFYWDPAAPSAPNWHLGAYGNPYVHQAIIRNPAAPFVPYQQMGAWGIPNVYPPIMPGIVDQRLGGLRSSSEQQIMKRLDPITPCVPNKQPGALGGSFLDQSLMGDGIAPYLQFQQPGVLGYPSEGRLANEKSSGAQENPTPISYHNYNFSNTQNDASQPPISDLLHQIDPDLVNLLSSPTDNTTQNMDVALAPTLNSERVSFETFFTKDIESITNPTAGDDENINNGSTGGNGISNIENSGGNYGKDIISIPDGPTRENPPPTSPSDSFFLDFLLDEAAIENDKPQTTAGNQEEILMEWDGFALAENLNLEDLDIIF